MKSDYVKDTGLRAMSGNIFTIGEQQNIHFRPPKFSILHDLCQMD